MISEIEITERIIEEYYKTVKKSLKLDVAIVGAGPSGLVAGYYLAKKKKKVAIFERKLSTGGGIWGGGMLFPFIVVEEKVKDILKDFKIKFHKKGELLVAKSVEVASKLTAGFMEKGGEVFNGVFVEDLVLKNGRVQGVVVNWTAVEMAHLHVDPICFYADYVIDATGHSAEMCRVLEKKDVELKTKSGKLAGEKSMWADEAEKFVIDNTGEVYPGLLIAGMAVSAVFGGPRMGPIFGGMFLSGKKISNIILEK